MPKSKYALLKSRPERVTASKPGAAAQRCRRKFLRHFPEGFQDGTYLAWERTYKWDAYIRWQEALGKETFRSLLANGEHAEIAARAVRIEAKTNLLFSFEKMALRDAVKSPAGAELFASGLWAFLYGDGSSASRFDRWVDVVAHLPRKKTRVLTWPAVTVFGFIAQPRTHMFMKPNVMGRAAKAYGHELTYRSRPDPELYRGLLQFAGEVRRDLSDLKPRDMIDIQSFLWVQGSDEYPD
jgi:hypothetical protein